MFAERGLFHVQSIRLVTNVVVGALVILACVQLINASRSSFRSSFRSSLRSSFSRTSFRRGARTVGTHHSFHSNRPWYGSGWNHYATSGYIYGYTQYRYTRYYRDNPYTEPTICYNDVDNLMENGTTYEWFICPNITQGREYNYCCGDSDRQYCCRFWDDVSKTAGVVVGIVAFVIIFIAIIFKCCVHKTHGKRPFFQRKISSRFSSIRPSRPHVFYSTAPTIPPLNGEPMSLPQTRLPSYPVLPETNLFDPPPYPYPPESINSPNTGYSNPAPAVCSLYSDNQQSNVGIADQGHPSYLPYPVNPVYPSYPGLTQNVTESTTGQESANCLHADNLPYPNSTNQPPPPGFNV